MANEIVNKKPPYKISVGALFICFAKDIDKGEYETEITKLDVVKKIGVTENGSSTSVYASGKKYDTVTASAGTNLSVDEIAFPDEMIAKMRGDSIGSKYGGITSGASNVRPYFMAGYVEYKSGGIVKYTQYPKCQLSENTNDIETKTDSFSEQTDTITIASEAFDDAGNDKYSVQSDNELFPDFLTEDLFFSKVVKSDDDIDSLKPATTSE